MTYNIIEVANTHAGDLTYMMSLIDEFSHLDEKVGIKFQAFKYDQIAAPDYYHYNLYKTLFFNDEEWQSIISTASHTKDVWLDIFDEYGVHTFHQNKDLVFGVKLQPSVLYNHTVLKALARCEMTDKMLILNIAGLELDEIRERVETITDLLNPFEVLIEVGFQAYPTKLVDSGLAKISRIKELFSNRIVFADHVDGESSDAVRLPVMAALLGADVIEKHVMHSSRETKYDAYSSVVLSTYEEYLAMLRLYCEVMSQEFITPDERRYLENTKQIPLTGHNLSAGSIVAPRNLIYRRSDQRGLSTVEVERHSKNFNVLARSIESGKALSEKDFRKAVIATIIACRLKSSRLKGKALLPIGKLSSIETCIKNCLSFESIDFTVLASSDTPEDAQLAEYTYRDDVVFFAGDPDNVIRRYLDIAQKYQLDVIVRVTGDCPFVSKEICAHLLNSHFAEGADYTCAKDFAVGTSVEIVNVTALKKVAEHFPQAEHSEYMTWYFKNNPESFFINEVELPKQLVRDYRLTLDYQEDLDLFNAIDVYFVKEGENFSTEALFNFLDANPSIAAINSHLALRYKTDKDLIEILDRETKMSRGSE